MSDPDRYLLCCLLLHLWQVAENISFLSFFCRGPIPLSLGCSFMEVQGAPCGPSLWVSTLRSWDTCFNSQVPPTEQDMTGEPSPLQGRKRVKKWNFWVLLGQLYILPCLPPPDLKHSWIIMVCHPLHTSHSNSVYICAARSRVAKEYLTWLWNTSSPLGATRPLFVTLSSLSEPLYPGSVDLCTENIVTLLAY